jgi:hypothetical protein
MTVTEHNDMLLFGIIDWYAHDFCVVTGLFKYGVQFLTLIGENGSLCHSEAPLFFAAASLQTAIKLCHRGNPDGS